MSGETSYSFDKNLRIKNDCTKCSKKGVVGFLLNNPLNFFPAFRPAIYPVCHGVLSSNPIILQVAGLSDHLGNIVIIKAILQEYLKRHLYSIDNTSLK